MTRKAVQEGRSAERSKPIQPIFLKPSVWGLVCAALCFVVLNMMAVAVSRAESPAALHAPKATHSRTTGDLAGLPLSFEPNSGQADAQVQFLSRGDGYKLFLTSGEADLVLSHQASPKGSDSSMPSDILSMKLLGAATSAPATGLDQQPGTINYFIGNDSAKWHTGIPTFGKVNFAGIYPGVDLLFYGNQRQLEYDFVVKPGGNPASIAWFFRGAQPRLGQNGSLELNAPGGALDFLAPVAYQMVDGQRRPVSASYLVAGETVRFALGEYDHTKTLIIDPVLSYFSYLGGTGNDYIGNSQPQGYGSPSPEPTQAVGIDAQGNLYVAGNTSSTDFPTASPVGTRQAKVGSQTWAFVSKFSPDGSQLLYSTYLGGSAGGSDAAYAIAVDSTGNAYVTGEAGTNDFPVTTGAFQTTCGPYWYNLTGKEAAGCTGGTPDAFVLKLNPAGSQLIYSSFLGGQGGSWGTGIAIDSAGQAYVTGVEQANGCGGPAYLYGAQYGCFPTTANALISDIGGGNPIDMAFMSVFNATGSALVYSTLFGDSQGAVSVKGAGCQADCGAGTYGTTIALDPQDNVYIGGRTVSANMVTTKGAFNTLGSGPIPSTPSIVNAPNGYGYVAKFGPVTTSGTTLLYSTYFGGGAVFGGDVGGLAADGSGNVYITGDTHAPDFPATVGAYQTTCDPTQLPTWCNQGAYVAKLNPTGTALVWATYLGNGSNAPLYFLGPVILDSAGDVYVLGEGTGKLPLGGGNLSTLNGPNTVYVAKFNSTGSQVLFGATVGGPGNGAEKAGGMAVDGSGNIYVAGAINSGGPSFATSGSFQQAFAGGNADGFVAKVLQTQPSTTTLTISPASPTVGQNVTFTAKVAGPQGSTVIPTGTVTFLNGTTTLGTGTLDSTGTATYSTTTLTVSTYSVNVDYAGDSNYSSSTAAAQTLTVNPVSTTTTLTASATTATTGTSITFTAAVAPASGSVVPTGTVTFKDGTTTLGTGTLDATGKTTYSTSSLATGSHSVTAVYAGDTDNNGSTSAALAITVNAPPPPDFGLSLTPTSSSVTAGSPATITVSVTPLNGFNSATTFTCSGLPAHSTCAFNPTSVTPSGTAAATTTLIINSDVTTAMISGGSAVFALLLVPIFGRRKRRSLLDLSIPVLLLAAVALGLTACGAKGSSGGGGGGGSSTNTPAGTYTITVTATSGSLSHTATYSYTVN